MRLHPNVELRNLNLLQEGLQRSVGERSFRLGLDLLCPCDEPCTTVFRLLQPILEALQPLLGPICFVAAWATIGLVIWSLWTACRDTTARAHQMHQIPCPNCQFFTADYRLKCPVHPSRSLTEEAIDCPDYRPTSPLL